MQCSSSVVEPQHTDLNRNKTKDTLVHKGLQDSFRLKTDLDGFLNFLDRSSCSGQELKEIQGPRRVVGPKEFLRSTIHMALVTAV